MVKEEKSGGGVGVSGSAGDELNGEVCSRSSNVLWRRKEQLERWQQSETNKTPLQTAKATATATADSGHQSKRRRRVKFPEGCVFMAACASGDEAEVDELLSKGADINTANVDGLTALHQVCKACIKT